MKKNTTGQTKKKRVRGKGLIKTVGKTIDKILPTRNNFPPKVRALLDNYGNEIITRIEIGRTPIQSGITNALNLLSGGQFGKNMRDLKYDAVFHLFMVATLQNGKSIMIEKNEVVKMMLVDQGYMRRAKDQITIGLFNSKKTLREFIDNAVKMVGPSIYLYNYKNNNCQVFIRNLLKANGLLTSQAETFIMQDAEGLLKKTPGFLDKVANTVTEAGAKFNRLVEGKGRKKKKKISINNMTPDF
jgi:hypothetical protein